MPSTVDQLQLLSNSELFLMCNKYQFAPRDIAYLTRRQLERRLHVAIVGERAMLRAHDLMQRIRSQKGHRDFNDWLGVNRIDSITQHLLPNSNRQKRMRNVSERRRTISLPNFQRFRGGVDPFMQIDELRQYSEESETLSQPDEMVESVGSEIDHLELTDEQKQQWRNEVRNQVRAIEAMNTDNIDWNTSVGAASDYYSLSESEESRSNLHFLSAEVSTERISNNQIQRREERLRTISTNNIPIPSKKSDDEPISNNQLQKAEGLWTSTSTHNFHLSESDDEGDCTPEQLLSTFNYMDDLQSGDHIKEKSFEKLFNNRNGENIIVGDALLSSPTNTNHRRTLWRCVFNMLCCNSQGKLDAGKLRYSILCCAMVICTYVGFKLLQ